MNNTTGARLVGGVSTNKRQKDDFYATEPNSVRALLDTGIIQGNSFYEPCCGMGHISEVLKEYFPEAKQYNSDLNYRGYGIGGVDYLEDDILKGENVDWIITNPPFKYAKEFIEKALTQTNKGVAMFLKLTFLESKNRKEFFENTPLKYVYVFSSRQNPMRDGLEVNPKTGKKWSSTVAYAWFIWEHDYTGEPILRWL